MNVYTSGKVVSVSFNRGKRVKTFSHVNGKVSRYLFKDKLKSCDI